MKRNDYRWKCQPVKEIIILPGSMGWRIGQKYMSEISRKLDGNTAGTHSFCVFFDHHFGEASGSCPVETAVGSISSMRIEAHMPDESVLEDLEAEGKPWFVPPERRKGSSTARENLGSGNDPRTGGLLFQVHREEIKRKLSAALATLTGYPNARESLLSGAAPTPGGSPIRIRVVLSPAGGTGSGSLRWFLELIVELKEEFAIHGRVEVIQVALGNFRPPNHQKAFENQRECLKLLCALAMGYAYEPGAEQKPCPFDSLTIIGNNSEDGMITRLDELESNVAQMLMLESYTAVGTLFNQHRVDIESESPTLDRFGVPKIIKTVGLSVIHLDIDKVACYCANRMAYQVFSRWLSAPHGSDEEIFDELHCWIRNCELAETEDESAATERVLRLPIIAGQTASERVFSLWEQKLPGWTVFSKAFALDERLVDLVQREMKSNLLPLLEEAVKGHLKEIEKSLSELERTALRGESGLTKVLSILSLLNESVERFLQANGRKMDALLDQSHIVEERIANYRQFLDRMRHRRYLRPFYFLSSRQVFRSLQIDGREALRLQLDMLIRRLLSQSFYSPLREIIYAQATDLRADLEKIQGGLEEMDHSAETILNRPACETAAVGFELATPGFVKGFWEQLQVEANGKIDLNVLFDQLCKEVPTLESLHDSAEQIGKDLLEQAENYLTGKLSQLDIDRVFAEQFKAPSRRQECLSQCLKESRGRVRRRGPDAELRWIKILFHTEETSVQPLANEIKLSDRTAEEWLMVPIEGNRTTYGFFQYCADISPRLLLKDTPRKKPIDWRLQALSGPDPFIALMCGPDYDDGDVRRTLIQAACLGLLRPLSADTVTLSFNGLDIDLHSADAMKMVSKKLGYKFLIEVFDRFTRQLEERSAAPFLKTLGELRDRFERFFREEEIEDVRRITLELERYISSKSSE